MMSRRHLLLLLVMTAALHVPNVSWAERSWLPCDLYQRTSQYHGEPVTFPRQPQNTWYKWGYFGAYPTPRTHVGGHYSHRNHYTEIRFSAPR